MVAFDPADFPSSRNFLRAWWAPILMRPILGSPETLVIGLVVTTHDVAYLEPANSLDRLQCLFGENAECVMFAANAALAALREDILQRGPNAVRDFRPSLSGVCLGTLQQGEGASIPDIARSWLASLSSLHQSDYRDATEALVVTGAEAVADRITDRLPNLVLDYVTERRPGLAKFFRQDIRARTGGRRGRNASDLIVDYAGSRVVASFGTLSATKYSASVDRLKRRLWDLIVARDREQGRLAQRPHEILVQSPSADDPQFTDRQHALIGEGIRLLSSQAEQKQITFHALTTVPDIGNRLLFMETGTATLQ